MLPKPEKKSKKNNSEQLDLVETVDEGGKIEKKRRLLLVFLFLTVGLSLILALYRHFQSFDFSTFKISSFLSPAIQFLPKNNSKNIPADWIFVVNTSSGFSFSFPQNSASPNLSSIKNPSPLYAKKYLPQGVLVSESNFQSADYFEISSILTTPKTTINLYAKIPGKISQSPNGLENYSQLVRDFYWQIIDLDSDSD